MQLIMTAQDRANFGLRTGLYEICIFGLKDQNTVGLTPVETVSGGRYDCQDSVIYTVNVFAKRTASHFRYTSTLLSQAANLTVKVEGLNMNTTAGQLPTRIYYRVCDSTNAPDCLLNASEMNGTLPNMIQMTPNVI